MRADAGEGSNCETLGIAVPGSPESCEPLNLVTIPEARWIRLDALDALADADTVAPGIVANVTPAFLLKSPPVLAASAAHLVGAHASPSIAVKMFERIASSNKRRALLLVGANAMKSRNRAAADRIIDLLEPDHPGRQLLAVEQPLPFTRQHVARLIKQGRFPVPIELALTQTAG